MKTLCVVLLLLAEARGHGQSTEDRGPQGAAASTVSTRLDQLERLVLQQQETNARQEQTLRLQEETLSRQQTLIGQHAADLSRQHSTLIRQDTLLRRQENLLRQQNRLLRQQGTRMFRQEELLFQYTPLFQRLRDPSEARSATSPSPHFGHGGNSTDSASHDVIARAMPPADSCQGACQAVLDQLGLHVSRVDAEVQALSNSHVQQTLQMHDARSSVYVHWGSSYCGANASETVYSGVVGGAPYNHGGGATNFLCLTLDPVFSGLDVPSEKAILYGAQYSTDDSHDGYDPVCSVCRASFSNTVMVPGTNVCAPGWNLLYSGFLMAGDFTKASGSQFICVDSLMDSRVFSGADRPGKLLSYTVTQCSSTLPCGPYLNHKVVTCAVCGK